MAQICCPVGFREEVTVVFWIKMFQINTESDKKPKFSKTIVFIQFLSRFR